MYNAFAAKCQALLVLSGIPVKAHCSSQQSFLSLVAKVLGGLNVFTV